MPVGLDISADGKTLYVANSGGNNLSVINLTSRTESKVAVSADGFSNDTPLSVATAQNGLVIFSTTFLGSGFGARMLQYNPTTKAVSPRTDFWYWGTTTEATYLKSSADHSTIGIVAGDISSAPVFKYTSSTNTFTPEKDLNGFISTIASNETGSVFLVDGTYVLDANLNLAGTIPGTNYWGAVGGAIDPSGVIAYRPGTAQIDVLNLSNFTKTGTLPLSDTILGNNYTVFSRVGQMSISRDGSLIAMITDNGISLIKTGTRKAVGFENLTASAKVLSSGNINKSSFSSTGLIRLGNGSNGINPVKDDIQIGIGSTSFKIPAGSFKQNSNKYTFNGTIDKVQLNVQLVSITSTDFQFTLSGQYADLTGTSLPLTISLSIGDDNGSVKIPNVDASFKAY